MTTKGGNDWLIAELLSSGAFHVDDAGRLWRAIHQWQRYPNAKRPAHWTQCATVSCYGYLVTRFRYATLFVHRIVYAALLGQLVEGMEINHKNGDKQDNRPENLELVTNRDNQRHAVRHGLRRPENTNTARLTWAQVRDIRRRAAERSASGRAMGREYGVTHNTISSITRRKTWKEPEPLPVTP